MSNTNTFNWQRQPIVRWKETTIKESISVWSRPLINGGGNNRSGTPFKANPIQHWRKQLNPNMRDGESKSSIGMSMDVPNGTSRTFVDNCQENNTEVLNNHVVKNNSSSNNNCHIINGKPGNVIRRSNTNLQKTYYTDSRAYLKSRCKTFNQNISGNITSDSSDTNERTILNCSNPVCNSNEMKTIYKPNNHKFSTQGAVSSSDRLQRLKMDTINLNGASFKTAYGSQAANAGRYHGTSESPFFIKSKENSCSKTIYHRNGNHTSCYKTLTHNVGNKH